MTTTHTLLQDALAARLPPEQSAWLGQALARIGAEADAENTLLALSAMAGRKLGSAPLGGGAPDLPFPGGAMPAAHWTLAEAGRVLLLLAARAAHPAQADSLAGQVFRQGDEAEAGAALRGLALLDEGGRLKAHALEAGRTNNKALYSCLLQHNPYPAAFYTDHEFNQLVLKALFLGLPITAVAGLAARANPELSRMCEDYIDERLAAGRGVPGDIWLALGPHASAHGLALLRRHAEGKDPEHRRFAALALAARTS